YTAVPGYSAAQANHLICVPSSHGSVQPRSLPSTARPATSQRDSVSLSLNGASGTDVSGTSVTRCGRGPGVGGEATLRDAAAGRGGGYEGVTQGRPASLSASTPALARSSSRYAFASLPPATPSTSVSAGRRPSGLPRLLTEPGVAVAGAATGLYFSNMW